MVGIQRIKVYRNPKTMSELSDLKWEIDDIISPDQRDGFFDCLSKADNPTP
jgi:hypothetical protein